MTDTMVLGIIFLLNLLVFLVDMIMTYKNMSFVQQVKGKIPDVLKDKITSDHLTESNRYTRAQGLFTLFEKPISFLINWTVLLCGVLPLLVSFLAGMSELLAGLIFFLVLGISSGILSLPFEYYKQFKIEDRFGFNTQTASGWISDKIKMSLVSMLIGGLLLGGIMATVTFLGTNWWVYAFILFMTLQLTMMVVYPLLIAPLFNKFTEIEDRDLLDKINEMATKANIPLSGIYQMDASKRTKHTNAYFTGIGKSKRIVLFDSLITSHPKEEIIAILAHEAGHMVRGHIKKQLMLVTSVSLFVFFCAGLVTKSQMLYSAFGFESMPVYVGLLLLMVVIEPLLFFLKPVLSAISRKYEYEADAFSVDLTGDPDAMENSLVRLVGDNLSNLFPHPLYVFFHYSHPPIPDRINAIRSLSV